MQNKKGSIALFAVIIGGILSILSFELVKNIKFDDSSIEKGLLNKLSLEEKIGQLFIIGFEGKEVTPELTDLLKTIYPGGLILFSRNIQNENQLQKLIIDLQNISLEENNIPLFIAIDQEGGSIRRIKWIDDNISQAEIKNGNQAYQTGFQRGKELKNIGINLNLAPVLDLAEENDFLYNRSFKNNPETTGELGKNLVSGQKAAGIFSAIKHFPGYSGIRFNPETIKIPVLSKIPEISQFKKTMEANPELIMTANVIYSEIDNNLPLSLSDNGIKYLKEKVRGNYLIISDDLASNVLKEKFSLENSVISAKKAGVDILLIGGWKNNNQDQLSAFNSILQAVKNKVIDEKIIDDSVLKIIKLKQGLPKEIIKETKNANPDSKNLENPKNEEIISQPKINTNNDINITKRFINWGYKKALNRSIDTIIIHSAYDALGENIYSIDGVLHEFKLYTAGPHYLISRDGIIYQLVSEQNIGYHAGTSKMPDGRTNINNFSIGIEILYHEKETPNNIQYQRLAELIKNLKSKYEITSILGHKDIAPSRKTDPWNFDWEKFNEELEK